ncbi:MAG TPA: hypothetical protein VNB90_14245 [Cytophagaceae bacterium]|nr:hypothetical protein [Cytophagaceae bacterium]
MNKQTFIQLIKDPSGISPEQLLELEKVVAGFPYCQVAHILIAKQAADAGSMLADQKLKKAAAYTLDRKNLKKLIADSKEIPDITRLPIQELPVIAASEEKAENKIQEPETKELIPSLSQENNLVETTPSIQQVESELKEEKNNFEPHESLSDEKRDQIIKELQENLKRLHDIKLKAAWEDIPKEIKVIGINDELDAKETEKNLVENSTELPAEETEIKTEEDLQTEKLPELPADVVESAFPDPQDTTVEETTFIQEDNKEESLNDWINPEQINYPIRTEDVEVDILETAADANLMLDYLDYLEEKRSIFRKNKKKEIEIIERFIKEDPTIPKLDINNLPDNSVDLSSKSSTISKGPVSENFAKILVLQGKKEKAIEIYEQLILKNPEKKPYFEAQIEKLKNKI